MISSLSEIDNKKQKKEFINLLEEIYQHLVINSDINGNFQSIRLVEMGLISNINELDELSSFINKNCSFSEEDFYNNISNIDHSNPDETCSIPLYCNRCRNVLYNQEEIANKPTLVDLFCGAGGMSLGFKQAGFKILYANDIEEVCIETYKFNHPEVNPNNIVLGDIQNIAGIIPSHIGNRGVDVVIGGPPCQGFSNANRQRLIDDPRNRLYREYVEVVSGLQPTFFVMENVIGMQNIADQIIEDFNNIGYEVEFTILNASDFSVPQNRRRIIFIGNRIGINNQEIFNRIIGCSQELPSYVLEDAIGDLPPLEPLRVKNATDIESEESGRKISAYYTDRVQNEYINLINNKKTSPVLYNHKARYNNDRDIEIFSRLHQGDKSDDPKIADIMPYQSRNNIFKDKYYKLIYNQPCKTITAHMKYDCNMYIHPTQPRGLTPREAARVQSFPDSYFFRGAFTKTYMQIGNSVPPLMSRVIAKVINSYLLNERINEDIDTNPTTRVRQMEIEI